MFKILILDDNINRINNIIENIEKNIESKVIIDYQTELKNGIRELQKKHYDMLICDIQLPSMGCDGIDEKAGISLIKTITDTDRIKKPTQIIGITSYDNNYAEIENEMKKFLCLLLKYDSSSQNWLSEVCNKVKYSIKAKKTAIDAYFNDNECDCLIITAVDTEMKAVLNCGINWEEKTYYNSLNKCYCGISDDGYSFVVIQQQQMGMTCAAATCCNAISWFKPKIVSMVGIAAGNPRNVKIGDIIVADSSWDYGSGKMEKKDGKAVLLPDPHYIGIESEVRTVFSNLEPEVIDRIQQKWEKDNGRMNCQSKLCIGALASGAAVIQTEDVVLEYIQPHNRKNMGLDMETYAIYYAATNAVNKPLFVSIKGVCDYADSKKSDDYQAYSAFLSINVLLAVMHDLMDID